MFDKHRREARNDDRHFASDLFRPRQSDECDHLQWLHGGLAANGAGDAQTKSHLVDLRSLVRPWDWCHDLHSAKDHSRLRRISCGTVSGEISRTWRSRAGAPGSETVVAPGCDARRFMGTGPWDM